MRQHRDRQNDLAAAPDSGIWGADKA